MTPRRERAFRDISTLKARYFRFVDQKDWSGLAALFTQDVCLDATYAKGVYAAESKDDPRPAPLVIEGRQNVLDAIRQAVGPYVTVHHGFMPELELLSEDEATGIWAMHDEIFDVTGKMILIGDGHYLERYRKIGPQWAIASLQLIRLRLLVGDIATRHSAANGPHS